MTADEIDAQDAALLERLGAIARAVDPVPDHVVELGKAAFGFRDPDAELLQMVERPVDASLVRSSSASSRLHFFEHGDLTLDLEVTVRGGFATVVGAVSAEGDDHDALSVTVETPDSRSVPDVVEGSFTIARLPLGLVRVVVRRQGGQALSTGWIDVG